jgi:hypothetical protein
MNTLWVMYLVLLINGEPDYDTLHVTDTLYLTKEECMAAASAEAQAAGSDPLFLFGLTQSKYDDMAVGCIPHEPTHEDGRKEI